MMRSHYCGHLNAGLEGQTVTLCGWVHRRRDHGGVIFLDIRDREGLAQVVFNPDNVATFNTADRVRSEFVVKATGVQRAPQQGAEGPLANTRFLEALFTPESLESKRNTEAVEFGTSQMVAGRIIRYEAAHTEPLAAVEADVKRLWVADKAAELAKKAGEDKLAEWKADASKAQGLAAAQVISRNDPKGLPREVVDAALVAPVKDGAAAWTGVSLGKAGYAVVKINKVVPNEHKDAEFARQAAQQYVQLWSSAEGAAYYETLKNRFKVQIKVPRP